MRDYRFISKSTLRFISNSQPTKNSKLPLLIAVMLPPGIIRAIYVRLMRATILNNGENNKAYNPIPNVRYRKNNNVRNWNNLIGLTPLATLPKEQTVTNGNNALSTIDKTLAKLAIAKNWQPGTLGFTHKSSVPQISAKRNKLTKAFLGTRSTVLALPGFVVDSPVRAHVLLGRAGLLFTRRVPNNP